VQHVIKQKAKLVPLSPPKRPISFVERLREIFHTVTAKPDLVRISTDEIPKSNVFSKHIGALCIQKGTTVDKLAEQLKMEPEELLGMIDGRLAPTKQVIAELAKALDADVQYLEKLAEEIITG
jgi:hypothetical protein